MIPRFIRPVLSAASASVLSLIPVLAQEPDYVVPLWENNAHSEIVPLSTRGPADPSALTTPPPSDPDEPIGFAPMSVPETVAGEIQSLAAALENNPVKIFNYVRNNIDYEQYYGLRKGPELTLLEGSANDLDTCVLLGELLKAAGVSQVHYYYQIRRVPLSELPGWMGLADEPWPGLTYEQLTGEAPPQGMSSLDAKRIVNFFNFQDERGTQAYGTWPDDTQSVGVSRFWVRINYQGVDYDLDPSFKKYEKFQGANLKAALGYNLSTKDRAALLSTAGGSTASGYVATLNNTNIGNFLNTRTQDLLVSLQSQYPGWTVEEIIRGRKLIREEIANLSEAHALPNDTEDGLGLTYYWTNTISDNLKSWVTFTSGGMTYDLPTSDLKGRKVALAASGNEVQLWIDDTKVASRANVTESTYSFTVEVTHPGLASPYRETKIYKKHNDYVYAIIYGFNASGRLIQMRHEELQKYLRTDATGTGRAARSEILNIMGLTWLYQTKLATAALAAQNDVIDISYHRFGRMAQEQGFYVDVSLQLSSSHVADGVKDHRFDNVFHLGSMFWSAMEHGIIEQLQPGSSAISTVNILRRANETGNKHRALTRPATRTKARATRASCSVMPAAKPRP